MIMFKMNTINMGNPSTEVNEWSNFDWKLINRNIVKLRGRIFEASKNRDFRLLRALQHLMLSSKSNIAYSIRHVSYNTGSRTPGVDGMLINSPKDRYMMYIELSNSNLSDYRPKAVKRVYIIEGEKHRPIGIPTIKDRVVQLMVKNALEPEWEATFEKSSYGFRPKRSVNDAVNRIWLTCNKENCRTWVVDADISKCFDTTSHNYILETLKYFPGKSIIENWLECGVIANGIWFDTEGEGTPQGNIISPLLCNISLHGLEEELGIRYNSQGYIHKDSPAFIRYADDIVIFSRSRQEAEILLSKLSQSLQRRSQEISEAKTRIVHICEGFDFLGFNFKIKPKDGCSPNSIRKIEDNYQYNYAKTGFYVTPSDKSILKIKTRIKNAFTKNYGKGAADLIMEVNPIIRGWAQSKIFWHSNRTFHVLDHYLYNLSWRWMKRSHPGKNTKWIKNKYFKHLVLGKINNKWTFFSKTMNGKELYLLQFKWFSPRNYNLTKIDKNPDNPKDKSYYI